MKYIFSWYSYDMVAKILHRPWWKFWRKSILYHEAQWVRHIVSDIPEDQGKLLEEMFNNQPQPMSNLILRLMGNKPKMLQLEYQPDRTNKFPSEYVAINTIRAQAPTEDS